MKMLRNYLLLAWRNLVKVKGHSFINIAGLSVGMAVAIMIGLWINDEVSFDKDNTRYNRIAQVMEYTLANGKKEQQVVNPIPLATTLKNQYGANFKSVVTSFWLTPHFLKSGNIKVLKQGNYFDGPAVRLLDLKMVRGTKSEITDVNSVYISESLAKSLYGDKEAMNQVFRVDDFSTVKIAGIYKDFPANSSFAGTDFIGPWAQVVARYPSAAPNSNNWWNVSFQIFVELADNTTADAVSARIRDSRLNNGGPETKINKPEVFLHPMSKWHLYNEFGNGVNTGGAVQYVWLFGLIGFFVLLLACINFMNLSTARSQKRAKEVGIRKAIGSLRSQLIGQFFVESILLAFIALILALGLVQLALPWFNNVAGKSMQLPLLNVNFWLAAVGFSLLTGLIAGSYPALYLSSFSAVKVLKGTFRQGRLAALPRQTLVVLQFTVSVMLIVATIVVYGQIQFAKNRPSNYDRAGLVMVPMMTEELHKHFKAVQQECLQTGGVTSLAESNAPTTAIYRTSTDFDWSGKDPALSVEFPMNDGTVEYGKTVGWKFAAGRDFSNAFGTDSMACVINQAAADYMQLKNPLAESVKWGGKPHRIIGVIKNMVVTSPFKPAEPTIYTLNTDPGGFILVRLKPGTDIPATITKLQTVFSRFSPEEPITFQFADEEYARKFSDQEKIGKLSGGFSVLAIFISCLGLFGMASYMAEQRIKEVGVRKVLGATVMNLWRLLTSGFVKLIFVSLAVSLPLSGYLMNRWLQQFPYRSTISAFTFIGAAGGALIITLLTVSYQAIRAATANPAKSLKVE